MKTIVYVDAFNLQYGLLRDVALRWLDLEKFVFNPHSGACNELRQLTSFYKNIPADLPARCQLPDEIPVGTHGNVIRRPAAWR